MLAMRHTNDWNNCFRSRQLPLVHYSYPHIATASVAIQTHRMRNNQSTNTHVPDGEMIL